MKPRIRGRCGKIVLVVTAAAVVPATTALSFEPQPFSQGTFEERPPWMSNTQNGGDVLPKTSWWPPSRGYNIIRKEKPGVVPGTMLDFFPSPDHYHQEELSFEQRSLENMPPLIPHDPAAAMQLCNTLHQAACDALIYQQRWRYCVAVWDERLLEWMQGAASPGNFWTPKTYMVAVAAAAGEDNSQSTRSSKLDVDNHPIWKAWEGAKLLELAVSTAETDSVAATAAAAENVKKLRSLASRILPRLDDSGRKETDLPVFDTLVVTSLQLQSLLQEVAAEAARKKTASEANQHQHNDNHHKSNKRKKRKKQRRQKNQDVPWVVPVFSAKHHQTVLLPSLKVLQAAKQLIVVQTTETFDYDQDSLGSSLEELFPNAMWLETASSVRVDHEASNNDVQQQVYVPPQAPEEVAWGKWQLLNMTIDKYKNRNEMHC